MRLFLIIFIFIIVHNPIAKANDINDLQIEGISIGDSILDFYNKQIIKDNIKQYTNDKTFSLVEIQSINSEMYDALQLHYKTNDKNYVITGISGIIDCRNDFNICKNNFDKISSDLISFFGDKDEISEKKIKSHAADKTGKSKSTSIYFNFENGGEAAIQMTNWTKKMDLWDHLRIQVHTKEMKDWYKTAYE